MLNRIKEAESELADIQRAFAKLTDGQAKADMAEEIGRRVMAINEMRRQRHSPERPDVDLTPPPHVIQAGLYLALS